jgi:4-hydroxy-2-oxoheptanedioate aldolase
MRYSSDRLVSAGVVATALLFASGTISRVAAQSESASRPYQHINAMVEKLAQGKPVVGISTGDMSMENAHAIARADVDFVRIEMEHGPMNFEALRNFLVGMIDKAAILKTGNPQVAVTPIARFSPFGREQQAWVIKQALDIGLMGYIANGVDNKEQALEVVRSVRYPQQKGSQYMEPLGLRGYGPMNAMWFWGISSEEYLQRADVWPLNPRGDILAAMMIETVEGLKNVDAIASVPGVGMLFPGNATDLSMSMGVPFNSPQREAALQTVLKACIAHHIACGIAAVNTPAEAEKRVKEGWKYIELSGAGVLTGSAEATLRAARAASK